MPRAKQQRNVPRARALRSAMSLPEVLLWNRVRAHPTVKIRRQHPVGPYVLDFYCASANVCIEIDGIAHDLGERPSSDANRDAWLAAQGIYVVRIAARDVLEGADDVAAAVIALCER